MKKNLPHLLLAILLVTAVSSCMKKKQRYFSPKGYDLNAPEKFTMPQSLLEISGIAYEEGKYDTIYSVQDEDGDLYRQKWGVKAQKNTHFAQKGDFEDLAIMSGTVFILKSNGHFYTFPLTEANSKKTKNVQEWKKLLPDGEYEGVYADKDSSLIYVLCKACAEDKKTPNLSGFIVRWDASANTLYPAGSFHINTEEIKGFGIKLKTPLKPSGLTKNRLTDEWYILSSLNKLLVVTDEKWQIKNVFRLNAGKFNQPEGITFDANHNLYISNEGDELSEGNILKFIYQPTVK